MRKLVAGLGLGLARWVARCFSGFSVQLHANESRKPPRIISPHCIDRTQQSTTSPSSSTLGRRDRDRDGPVVVIHSFVAGHVLRIAPGPLVDEWHGKRDD